MAKKTYKITREFRDGKEVFSAYDDKVYVSFTQANSQDGCETRLRAAVCAKNQTKVVKEIKL